MVDENVLVDKAINAFKMSYAPYSEFHVGAAVSTKSGMIFTGCNVENASYGATVCAERTAIFKGVSEGYRDFDTIAIAADKNQFTYPCGICLQVMSEFNPDINIILTDLNRNTKHYKLKQLLSNPYVKERKDG